MSIASDIAADFEAIEAEVPTVFTWSGTEYPCLRGAVTRGRSLAGGGFSPEADLVILVRTSLFTTRPEAKQKLTFDSRIYVIDEVLDPLGSPFLKLICNDVNQRM